MGDHIVLKVIQHKNKFVVDPSEEITFIAVPFEVFGLQTQELA